MPQAIVPAVDGTQCQRLAVHITRTTAFLFGGVAGLSSGKTDVHSVGRALMTTSATEVPGVVALEPTGCDAIRTEDPSGPGAPISELQVGGVGQRGVILADSDASDAVSCGANGRVIMSEGRLVALPRGATPGLIGSVALAGPNFGRAYGTVGAGTISPTPPSAKPQAAGRSVHRHQVQLLRRRRNSIGAALDALGGPPFAGPVVPAGFTPPPLLPCTVTTPLVFTVPVGDYYIDCSPFVVQAAASVSFGAGSRLVFTGGIRIETGGCLAVGTDCITGGAPIADSIVYNRSGDFIRDVDSRYLLLHTFLHLANTSGADGRFIASPDPTLNNAQWTAPVAGAFGAFLAVGREEPRRWRWRPLGCRRRNGLHAERHRPAAG